MIAAIAQHREDALAFAEGIDADDVAALGKQPQRVKKFIDLVVIRRMAKDRQAESRLGDEDVAWLRLEGSTGRVRAPLVITGNDDAAAAISEHDLGATQD